MQVAAIVRTLRRYTSFRVDAKNLGGDDIAGGGADGPSERCFFITSDSATMTTTATRKFSAYWPESDRCSVRRMLVFTSVCGDVCELGPKPKSSEFWMMMDRPKQREGRVRALSMTLLLRILNQHADKNHNAIDSSNEIRSFPSTSWPASWL